jgi:outer membrane protein assembly factor BamD
MNKIFGLLFIVLLSGCGVDHAKKADSAQKLISDAETLFNSGYYKKAAKVYKNFEIMYPSDSKVPQAMYKRGLAYFKAKNFALAAAAFEVYVENYPASEFSNDAYKKIFYCFFKQINRNDRDQSIFQKALESGENYKALGLEDPEFEKAFDSLRELLLGNYLKRIHSAFYHKPAIWPQILVASKRVIEEYPNNDLSAEAYFRWIEFLAGQKSEFAKKDALFIYEKMKKNITPSNKWFLLASKIVAKI